MIQSTAVAEVSSRDEWVLLQKQCKAFIASGFLPEHITQGVSSDKALARAVTIVIKGRELGIPPMQAFSSISVIKGKPCLSAELMLALIYQRVKTAEVSCATPKEKQHLECTMKMRRHKDLPWEEFQFTIEDAKNAGLLSNDVWRKYPKSMLRARAISSGARVVFPDCIMGCYTPEELGGEVIDVELLEERSTPVVAESGPRVVSSKAPTKNPTEAVAPQKPKIVTASQQQTTPPLTGLSQALKKPITNASPSSSKPPLSGWDEPCSDAQRKRLWAMCKGDKAHRDELLFDMFGDDVVNEAGEVSAETLTKRQIKEVFTRLELESKGTGREPGED